MARQPSDAPEDLPKQAPRQVALGKLEGEAQIWAQTQTGEIRILVGTRKGAFVLTSDGTRARWDVSGPHFAGWKIYHLKGSPADPNRLYASQSSSWFGQLIQRSNDGGKSWEPVGNKFRVRRRPWHSPTCNR